MPDVTFDPLAAADEAIRLVPPLWPLTESVAVNPFLGHADDTLEEASARLSQALGVRATMPRAHPRAAFAAGRAQRRDIEAVLADRGLALSVEQVEAALANDRGAPRRLPTAADLAARASGTDWPRLIEERFGAFAAGYFDEGQALWASSRRGGAYAAWQLVATHDLTPEIAGLSGFAQFVLEAPQSADAAIAAAVKTLGVSERAAPRYFHALLSDLAGWGQLARYRLWQAELVGETDSTARELLAIRLVFEMALLKRVPEIAGALAETMSVHAAPLKASTDDLVDAVLQEALERAEQRTLAARVADDPGASRPASRPEVQGVFCIDVRSEVFRRAWEAVDERVATMGFAGFFGVATAHRRFASDVVEKRLPVLLNPPLASAAAPSKPGKSGDFRARIAARGTRAWRRFKLAAVSSFAFVEAMGPVYVWRLCRDAFGRRTDAEADPAPSLTSALAAEDAVQAAASVLRAMSLTQGFAPIVLLAGHGARVANNAHASALQCGACGGYSGEVNARLLAGLLNDASVREGLKGEGIEIPADTVFLAGLHDTTSDTVTLYTTDGRAPPQDRLAALRRSLAEAGVRARTERALRLPRAEGEADVLTRGADWSEPRHEWGLVGCSAFIAAPRRRTAGRAFGGRTFLHDYDWKADGGFSTLELILTAPVVVASWISLQYYGSVVAPSAFGSGNKLLHNVTGGVGVVEGNGGKLRGGLPMQSVHDGEAFVHDPLRLTVAIEAPCEAILDILSKHEAVRTLFDRGWLHLFALDEAGRLAFRYVGDLTFREEASGEIVDAPREVA